MRDGVRRLLVLEDDAEFCEDFAVRAPSFLARVPGDWEQLMFGGQIVRGRRKAIAYPVTDDILQVAGIERTHAYAVQGKFMADLYSAWLGARQHCDQVMSPIQFGRKVYAPSRWLCGQAQSFSDIMGRQEDARRWQPEWPVATKPAGVVKECCGAVANAFAAAARVVGALAQGEEVLVSAPVLAERLEECAPCPANDGLRCLDCQCFIAAKARLATESCPRRQWRTALSRERLAAGGRILHQVWVQGEKELPPEYQANRLAWQAALPEGWRMVLWDDAMARDEWADYAAVSDECSHHAMRCDLILAQAQRDFGGIAMGTDVIPHNPAALFAVAAAVPAFAVVNVRGKSASNGVSWFAKPGHEFIAAVCKFQLRDRELLGSANVWRVTGPGAWFSVFASRLWNMAAVSDTLAYTRLYHQKGVVNPDAWVDPGYAASWHAGKP